MPWNFKKLEKAVSLIIILALTTLTGCLEISEEIHVTDSGEARVVIKLDGHRGDFSSALALPSPTNWQIDTLEIKDQDLHKDKPELVLRAERVVKPGQPFPHTFAEPGDKLSNLQLQFPTELRVWNDGTRTFYEFRRTYLSRRYSRFGGRSDDQVDEELEKRVMNQGIFNVTEADRTKYLHVLTSQIQLEMISLFEEALGEMIMADQLGAGLLAPVRQRAEQILEGILTPEYVLSILSLPDDSMGVVLDELKADIENRFVAVLEEKIADADSLTDQLRVALAHVNLEWAITEELNNDKFEIELFLPGVLIKTNGETNPDLPGATAWEFGGSALNDRSVELYALSVVEL